jgi:hypothetical protein
VYQFEIRIVTDDGGREIDHMTKAERLQFMRQRFKRKGGFPRSEPKPIAQPKQVYRFDPFGPSYSSSRSPKKWVCEADIAEAGPALKPRRTARKLALTRIAEQLPAKLPCVLF